MKLRDFGLTRYPFEIIPPGEPTERWADRAQLRADLQGLIGSWSEREGSGVYLLWADLGAGKTHAMRHLEWLLRDKDVLCVYSDLPDSARDFKEVFAQIVPAIPEGALRTAILNYRKSEASGDWLAGRILRGDRDTAKALWMLSEFSGQQQGNIARRWLRAERLSSRECAALDDVTPLRTPEQTVRALATILRLLSTHTGYRRVVLMLDEFQRIGQVGSKKIYDINAGIKSVYDACPTGLSIFLSYSFGDARNVKFLVSPELLNRVDRQFHLPHLSTSDAEVFVRDLLTLSAIDGAPRNVCFHPSAIASVIKKLDVDVGHALTPRKLSQEFGCILDSALGAEKVEIPITVKFANDHYCPPLADSM